VPADHVFDDRATSRDIFDAAARGLVRSVVDGYNGTVFAYGQTAAGKTHTMLGNKAAPGVLPLAVNEIMKCISEAPHRAFLIRCSYVEIYKETITDLLSQKTLEVHESKARASTSMRRRRSFRTPTRSWRCSPRVRSTATRARPA